MVACFQETSSNCLHWTNIYCTSLLLYCLLSIANIAMLSYIMHHYRHSQLEGSLQRKPKFWVLTFSITIYVIEFIRNFIGTVMPWHLSMALLITEQILQITVYILLCQFFVKAASQLVGKERVNKWKRLLIAIGFVACIALIVSAIVVKLKDT